MVRTAASHYLYRVESITVVDRTDAALLRRTAEPSITLVTCYPFRFIGPAPKRFETSRKQSRLIMRMDGGL